MEPVGCVMRYALSWEWDAMFKLLGELLSGLVGTALGLGGGLIALMGSRDFLVGGRVDSVFWALIGATLSLLGVQILRGLLRGEDSTRVCPVCAEKIQKKAIKCRFCGADVAAR